MMAEETLHRQNIVACIWDFDKTLIPGYMQWPIFEHFGVNEKQFWNEVNALPEYFEKQGQIVSTETVYLTHLLTYIREGKFKGLNNKLLRELGGKLKFYQGLPEFFKVLKDLTLSRPEFIKNDITLEHYVISTGLAEMIRGSEIAPFVENIYGCELIENPPPPNFLEQPEFDIENIEREISQLGVVVDNTIKTRFIFELNKGTNKRPELHVNAKVEAQDRRIPFNHMIYIADGPSDVPVFSVVKKHGGKTFAVYEPENMKEFAQNDLLLRSGRVDSYGRADYRTKSDTHMWLKLHVEQICEEIVKEQEYAMSKRVGRAPQHIHKEDPITPEAITQQGLLF